MQKPAVLVAVGPPTLTGAVARRPPTTHDECMSDRRKLLALKRDDTCASCELVLPAGTRAEWDGAARVVTCLACVEARDPSPEPSDAEPLVDRGTPGASARRRYDKLHDQRDQHVKGALGKRLGGLYLALSEEPQSTVAWAVGSRGERMLGEQLETLHDGESVYVLHDRRVPRSRANIDHLAVTRSGVWVIDAKNYEGKVQYVDRGGWFSTDERLMVGRRDCTKLVEATKRQVEVVRAVLQDDTVPVRGALCFVDAEWGWFAKPFAIDGVWIGWIRALGERLQSDGPITAEQIVRSGSRLARELRPA